MEQIVIDVSRHERRKVLEPQTSGFLFSMSEHPRLNHLRWWTDTSANDAHRILQGDAMDGGVEQKANEVQRFSLFTNFVLEPSSATDAEVGAGRKCNQQVPVLVEHVTDIALEVVAFGFGRKQIAGPGIVTDRGKSVPDSSRKFTRYQRAAKSHCASTVHHFTSLSNRMPRFAPTIMQNIVQKKSW